MLSTIVVVRRLATLVGVPAWVTAQFLSPHYPPLGVVLGVCLVVMGLTFWTHSNHWWPRLARMVAGVGILTNATAILVNGGSMPVFGMEKAHGVWHPVGETDRLLWLADRFGGASVGDIILGIAAGAALIVWAGTGVLRSLKRPNPPTREITLSRWPLDTPTISGCTFRKSQD